jgi:hypothetical protein
MKYIMTVSNMAEPRITFEITDCFMRIHSYYEIAKDAFRSIDIINAETGEVVLTDYRSDEWFTPKMDCGACISQMEWMKHMFELR